MTELLAYSAEHVCRLTGLSRRQLEYWDRTGFFAPRYADDNRRSPYSRIYSFQDVVGLRAIALLRNAHRVPLRELRAIGAQLAETPKSSWSSVTLYVSGRHAYFDDPATGARMAAIPRDQLVLPLEMQQIARAVREASNALRERGPEEIGQVRRHRFVAHNAPVLAGTRIPTSAVWNLHEAGYDEAAIIREYPRLRPEDVAAGIAFERERRDRKLAG